MASKSYFDYYDSSIQNNIAGIKLVLGGTGLGKTSSILKVISESDTNNRKFIYIANRLQLLNEMEEKLRDAGIGYAYLKSDTDVVLDVVLSDQKRDALYNFIEADFVQPYLEKGVSSSTIYSLDVGRIYQACDYIDRLGDTIYRLQRNVRDDFVSRQIRDIVNFIRSILQRIHNDNPQLHQTVLQKSIIQELFPYIGFQVEEHITVLLVTIQKVTSTP